MRIAEKFQAGVMVAVAGNGCQQRAGPFDAVDGEPVPLEGFPGREVVARRGIEKFVGVEHIVVRVGNGIGEVVGVDFDSGRTGAEGTAHGRQGKVGRQAGRDADGIAVGMIRNSLVTGQGRTGGDLLHVVQGFARIGTGGPAVDVKWRRRKRLGGFRCLGNRKLKT